MIIVTCTYLYFICETVELKSLRSHFHVNFIVFQTSDSWCQSTLMSFVNNFQLKIFQNNHFKTTAFSNNKCWAKLQDDLVVTSEMRFVFYSAVCGLIWALDKLLYSEDPGCNDTTSWRKLSLTKSYSFITNLDCLTRINDNSNDLIIPCVNLIRIISKPYAIPHSLIIQSRPLSLVILGKRKNDWWKNIFVSSQRIGSKSVLNIFR